jgi:hypothetical protein
MTLPDPHRARPARSRPARAAWAALGLVCVVLGGVGIVLPGLPTTPFLLLAAACFVRSSQSLYDRLLGHRRFGPLVRDYREGLGIPARIKALALLLMWVFVLFALGPGLPEGNLALRVVVGAAALIGSAYLLVLPTRRADLPRREAGPVQTVRPPCRGERT